jgi:N-acetylglucosaminyl-diphospho-decaprenol L-rhamnosyltransferase
MTTDSRGVQDAFPRALDIIIVTYNAREDVLACLESLHMNPPDRPWQLYVVDNASSDGTPEAVAARWSDVVLLRQPANIGFAAANNAGIAAGTAPLVLLLNSDTLVAAGQLELLCRIVETHPDVGVAGPRLVDAAGRPELSFGRMISPLAELRQKVTQWLLARGPRHWAARVEAQLAEPQDVDWVSGACLLARRTVLSAVGNLDTRYFMYAEDVDLCAAVRRAGYRVRFSPEAEIVHLRGRSRATAPDTTSAHYRRSQLAFYAKHHPQWAWLLRIYLRLKGALPP